MSNIYLVFLDNYVGDDERRFALVGAFDKLESAQQCLAEREYTLRTQYDKEWHYEWGWGSDAVIIEVELNNDMGFSSGFSTDDAWWSCLAHYS